MPRQDKAVKIITKTLDDKKAEAIEVIDVSERTPFAEYYILATATNKGQLNALKDNIIEELEKNKIEVSHVEGTSESGWILIDVHHVIVNIFSVEERERISLDRLLKNHQ